MLGATISLMLQTATPAATAPPMPDYALATNWAARAASPGAAAAIAAGASPAAAQPAVDVFYINPTSYRSDVNWNQPVADAAANSFTDGSVVARQAGIFNACCRVFVPRYRQASTRAFRNMAGGGEDAFAIAYSDVLRAFDHYITHDNKGRPFILVGHSQGARHAAQLLEDRIDGKALREQLVVAYVVGIDLAVGEFGARYKTITPCTKPTQTGCVAAWNSILPGADLDRLAVPFSARYVARFGDNPGKAPLCINPLTFDAAKPAAGTETALGAVPGDPDASPLLPLMAHAVAARCEKGFLIVEPSPALGLKPLPGGSMHYHDYGLFYADIRANALLRAAAWRPQGKTAR
jgi:pimeloyl-ACP methyl ester carboxylesterase